MVEETKSSKKYLFLILFVAIIALLIVAIRFDIGKVTSKYIRPTIKNIPIVKNILPKVTEDEPYVDYSKDQLINLVNGGELQLETLNTELKEKELMMIELERQIENLEVFEKEHLKFKEEKRKFDEQMASLDEDGFIEFYQQMYPEHANEVYIDIVKKQQMNKEQKKYAAIIAEMDATSAAKVLENLFQTDMDIILSILSNMDMESTASILEEMDSKIASTIVKQLAPE